MARPPRARGAARARARGDRARLLERALAERGRRVPRHPARHREDAHARRAAAPRRHCWETSWHERVRRHRRHRRPRRPTRRRACAACTSCSSGRAAARPAARARAARRRRRRREVDRVPALRRGAAGRRSRSPPSPLALAAFGGGYAVRPLEGEAGGVRRRSAIVPMHGAAGTRSRVHRGSRKADKAGNWPMELVGDRAARADEPARVLRALADRDGKPVAPCGAFRVHGKTTTVALSRAVPLQRASTAGS